MTKAELTKQMAAESELTQLQAAKALEAMVQAVCTALHKGDRVVLVGFGTFSVAKRAARKGRNPKTGKALKIPAKKAPKFTPGKALRKAV